MSSINSQLLELERDSLLDQVERINVRMYELIKSIENLEKEIQLEQSDD